MTISGDMLNQAGTTDLRLRQKIIRKPAGLPVLDDNRGCMAFHVRGGFGSMKFKSATMLLLLPRVLTRLEECCTLYLQLMTRPAKAVILCRK